MKKLILILVLLIAGFTLAQTKGKEISNAVVWTDTLGYTTLAPTTAVPIDSVWILNTNFAHGWYRLFMKGNANAQADSVVVQVGTVRYDEARDPQDTVWGSWSALKDSAWGDLNVMVNNTVGKDFLMFVPMAQLLKFTLLNYRAAIPNRNCVITINAIKP